MSGKKGRSGRKPLVLEQLKDRVVAKAWNKTNYKLGMADPQSFGIAKDIVIKDMVGKESVDMQAHITQEEQNILNKYTGNRVQQHIEDISKGN
jgi:hypothetical protein